jgi:hypothetical protein
MDIDLGFISLKRGGWFGTKITLNRFRGVWYCHIREYMLDGDSGRWFPTKKGISIPAESADLAGALLVEAGDEYAKAMRKELEFDNPQLELFDDLSGE